MQPSKHSNPGFFSGWSSLLAALLLLICIGVPVWQLQIASPYPDTTPGEEPGAAFSESSSSAAEETLTAPAASEGHNNSVAPPPVDNTSSANPTTGNCCLKDWNEGGQIARCFEGYTQADCEEVEILDPEWSGPVCGECTTEESSASSSASSEGPGCCICYYRPNDQCAGRTAETTSDMDESAVNQANYEACVRAACEDGIDNDGDGKIDSADNGCYASWDNSEETGMPEQLDCLFDWEDLTCKSEFEVLCKLKLQAHVDAGDCSETFLQNQDEEFSEEDQTRLSQCSEQIIEHEGHNEEDECEHFITLVEACASCAGPNCSSITGIDWACLTLANQDALDAFIAGAESIASTYGMSVDVRASQTSTEGECSSMIQVQVHLGETTVTYPDCHEEDEYCPVVDEDATCMDGTTETEEICCVNPNGRSPRRVFVRGDSCPEIEPCYNYTGMSCDSVGQVITCRSGSRLKTKVCCVNNNPQQEEDNKWRTGHSVRNCPSVPSCDSMTASDVCQDPDNLNRKAVCLDEGARKIYACCADFSSGPNAGWTEVGYGGSCPYTEHVGECSASRSAWLPMSASWAATEAVQASYEVAAAAYERYEGSCEEGDMTSVQSTGFIYTTYDKTLEYTCTAGEEPDEE